MSSESGFSSEGDSVNCGRLDDFGRPFERPVFQSIGESSVLSRVKEFLPLLKAAGSNLCEPKLVSDRAPHGDNIIIPRLRTQSVDSSVSGAGSDSSYGVEVDVGMGVYDVNGLFDETSASSRIPVIDTTASLRADNEITINKRTPVAECNLVEDITEPE